MPDTTSIILFALQGVLGLAMWLIRNAYMDLKDQMKENKQNIEKAFKKEDFKEFKEELWQRIDEIKCDLNQRLRDIKNASTPR